MNPFTIIEAEQRSAPWFAARCGRLTGSLAAHMLDFTQKGADGYKRRDLRARLTCERLTGQPQEDGYTNDVMQRGIDKEPEARGAYEAKTGNLVRCTGFLQHNSLMVGCSLDGDVDDFTGIVELKCPKAATHLSYLECPNEIPPNHRAQILHNMWVTGAEWCDFASFDDRFPEPHQLFILRIPRSPAWQIEINQYEKHALAFLAEIDAKVEKLRGAVAA